MVARPYLKPDLQHFVRRIAKSWNDRGLKIRGVVDGARIRYDTGSVF